MAELTVADQVTPMAALALLLTGHRGLPAAEFQIGPIYPELLRIAVHDQPGAFEAWLAAIAPDGTEVSEGLQGEGRARVRHAVFRYAGAAIDLVDFADAGSPS